MPWKFGLIIDFSGLSGCVSSRRLARKVLKEASLPFDFFPPFSVFLIPAASIHLLRSSKD